jgi:hypothetical protein
VLALAREHYAQKAWAEAREEFVRVERIEPLAQLF